MGAKTDFAAMSDDGLRRWIARRRGYRVLRKEEIPDADWREIFEGEGVTFVLEVPGVRTYTAVGMGTEESAWRDALDYGYEDEPEVPDWTGDLNAAWELFAEIDKAELCAHSVLTYDSATFHRFGHDGTAESAARAIAEAWAQWKEQNNDD